MSRVDPEKRKLNTLSAVARKLEYRTDRKIPIAEFHEKIECLHDKFAPRTEYKTDSDIDLIAYDLECLRQEGLLERAYLSYTQDEIGGVVYSDPGLQITAAGISRAFEAERSWLSRSIEKQPITFVQILISIVLAIVSGLAGWFLRGYLTL